jgi:hypothetical protein
MDGSLQLNKSRREVNKGGDFVLFISAHDGNQNIFTSGTDFVDLAVKVYHSYP